MPDPLIVPSPCARRAVEPRPRLAFLDADEFARACGALSAFARFGDYEDFLDESEGLQIGLAAAGAPVEFVPVSIDGFLSWSENFATPRELVDLHEFAADVARYRRRSGWRPVLCAAPIRGGDDQIVSLRRSRFDAWRQCMGAADDQDSLSAYATLIIELWRAYPASCMG